MRIDPVEWNNASRRRFLQKSGLGLGWLAASDLLHRATAAETAPNPLAAKKAPHPATAKSVISL